MTIFVCQEEGVNVTINSLHPGIIYTNLVNNSRSLKGTRFQHTLKKCESNVANPIVELHQGQHLRDNVIHSTHRLQSIAKKLLQHSYNILNHYINKLPTELNSLIINKLYAYSQELYASLINNIFFTLLHLIIHFCY